jgi:OPA family glycerol-3-phosphate transporter-like MFS transporter
MKRNIKFDKSTRLILLCWLVYTCSYIGKLSYSANISQIGAAFDVSYAQAGMVSTFFFMAYGVGQIVNGLLCKRYNVKYVVFFALLTGSAMNLLVAVVPTFGAFKFFWLINGAAMSFMWTTLIRLLSEVLDSRHINRAVLAMGTTVAAGTVTVYGLSALFAATLSFRWTFYVATAILLAVSLLWIFSYNSLTDIEKTEQPKSEQVNSPAPTHAFEASSLSALLVLLAVFAVITNLVKDGLTAWTPDILASLYATPAWLSILLTLLLPAMAIGGAYLAVHLHARTKNFIADATLLFIGSSALIGTVMGLLSTPLVPLTVACLAIVSCLMSGINNIVTSIVPLYLKDKLNSGKCAGILNGFCYLGSTVSSYGLGFIADTQGWSAVFAALLCTALVSTLLGATYLLITTIKHHRRKSI